MVSKLLFFTVVELWIVSVSVHARFREGQATMLASENAGFIGIDCGAEAATENPITRISYKTDEGYVTAGENQNILWAFNSKIEEVIRYYRDLRSFPTGKRNCYSLKYGQGKGKKFLVRASFMYGNYDGLNQTPEFDLYVGVNYWATVTFPSIGYLLYYEIIHVSMEDTINVCLVNTGKGVPFISALELQVLDMSIYPTSSWREALGTSVRWDFGQTIYGNFRYANDPYIRQWRTVETPCLVSINGTGETNMTLNNATYRVPKEVLATAVEPRDDSTSLDLTCRFPGFRNGYYVFFHFAEIERNKRREFTISLNNKIYGPFALEFSKPFSACPQKSPMQHEKIQISIKKTSESDHPPIINALEIYGVMLLPNRPTSAEDVAGILAIKQEYDLRKEGWQGDPCLPIEHRWSGLNCTSDSSPRITSLNLSSNKLRGAISLGFSNLTAIQFLDLSDNELSGPVPQFLGQLSHLSVLNLSGNKLTGHIPRNLKEKLSLGQLQLSIDRNPGLSMKKASERHRKIIIGIVGLISAPLLLLVLLIPLYIVAKRMKRGKTHRSEKSAWMRGENKIFSYSEIVRITNNFKTLIGEGGFGKVYRGNLGDVHVAVKLISPSSRQGYKEFQAEAQLLAIIHHRNLVSLIGYCKSVENMALIYDYMPNKDLRQHLSDENLKALTWNERLRIATDAASGLEYLHNGCKPPILHRDLKTANILLDKNMQAKIADFGLSRQFATESQSTLTATGLAGTPGYIDPEAQRTGKMTMKSDVYSFGIILLELLTGKRAIIPEEGNYITIVEHVKTVIQRDDIQSIIDPRLPMDFNVNSAWKFFDLGMLCVLPTGIERPHMSNVAVELKECLARETASPRPTPTLENFSTVSNDSSVPSPR